MSIMDLVFNVLRNNEGNSVLSPVSLEMVLQLIASASREDSEIKKQLTSLLECMTDTKDDEVGLEGKINKIEKYNGVLKNYNHIFYDTSVQLLKPINAETVQVDMGSVKADKLISEILSKETEGYYTSVV